ncbi:hypothetical protein [Streptomyces sp. IBSBF 2950]|uniref:hypothetical protein n=1 Tax=Streptomyces sp. IBSBF 2950 TaxID=2903528 RepID=UPI002FDC787F
MKFVISERMNVVQGRHCDSWTRVIGGRLFLFMHGHSPTYGGNTRARMTTRSVLVYQLAWADFKGLADTAKFTYVQRAENGSHLRHRFDR